MSGRLAAVPPVAAAPVESRAHSRALIRISDLAVDYGSQPALRDASLEIHPDRITALIGPSGCGKTTLLSCLNRMTDLYPAVRISGSIQLGDLDVLAPTTDVIALRRRVGMIFQKPNPFPLSIRGNLALPLRELGMRRKADLDAAIQGALEEVGLWSEVRDRLAAPAIALSGGQQQRLCIARALVLRPEVILMDEPCSALDPIASGVVEDLIASLRGSLTVVIVTHNLAQARRIADDVAVMWACNGAGCLAEVGATRQIFEDPRDPITVAYVRGERG